MKNTRLHPILPLAALLLVGLAPPSDARAELRCEMLRDLSRAYLKVHVRERQLTQEIEARTIENYLRRIDPSRYLFLESEADAVRSRLVGIFRKIGSGDCSPLTELQSDVVARHRRIQESVRAFVTADDYAVDSSVELVADAEERGFPKSAEERDRLIQNLVHFQISNYLTAETPLAEAQRLLAERYERRTHRVSEIDGEELLASFLDSYASALDPHSNYFSDDVLEDFKIHMTLSLEGIGVALSERDGYAVAEHIIPGGAADRHNEKAQPTGTDLRPRDKIVAVRADEGSESVDVIDMPLREVVSLIRGRKGTRVGLTILRQAETTRRFEVTIERDTIDLEEQAAKLRFEERQIGDQRLKLAVLSLPSFYGDADPGHRQSTADVARLLEEANREKADGLLIDLSRNGGGLLDHAVQISGYFIRRGVIVGVRDGRGHQQQLEDRDDGLLYGGPVVVHTSRASASASEILAGALKDYRRAVVTGDDHTFGKGTVQTVSELRPGQGALKITTAMFFRPGGRSTQKGGVRADVLVPSPFGRDDYGEVSQRYALPEEQIVPFLSVQANGPEPGRRWRGVTDAELALLAARSERRIAESEPFAELRQDLSEIASAGGVIRVSELLERSAENGAGAASDPGAESAAAEPGDGEEPATEEPEPLTPQLEEALAVLADWVALQRGTELEGVAFTSR